MPRHHSERRMSRIAMTNDAPGLQVGPCRACLIGLVVLVAGAAAHADSVRISGLWINDVSIDSVADGHIAFRAAGGSIVEQSLDKLGGIKLDRTPEFAQAEDALANGEPGAAAEHWRAAIEASREPWARQFARKRLVDALNEAGEATAAVEAYLALARQDGVEPIWLAAPPIEAVRAADEATRQALVETIASAVENAPAPAREHLERLHGAASQAGGAIEPSGAVVLPAGIDEDNATRLLLEGDFQGAREAAEQTLASSGGLSRAFYQHGRALLALAEQNEDEALYKSAGLSFMRSAVYFPRSRYVGPSLAEAGYVHVKIGRPDLARGLYDRARLQIDEEEDPAYHQRLTTLIQALSENN